MAKVALSSGIEKYKIFCSLKPTSLERFSPQCKRTLKVRLHWRDFTRDFALAFMFSKENK
jgi:hypothetical protein